MTGDDVQTQVILNCSALPCLLHLLSSAKESIRKEACWTISNITAGNRAQIQVGHTISVSSVCLWPVELNDSCKWGGSIISYLPPPSLKISLWPMWLNNGCKWGGSIISYLPPASLKISLWPMWLNDGCKWGGSIISYLPSPNLKISLWPMWLNDGYKWGDSIISSPPPPPPLQA